jgi:4-carboxymuconolactone decarboxylase
MNLCMLTALNRPHELKLHVRGAINDGWSVEEIMEVLLQTAIYCGVPAALDSTRVAREALKELNISLDGAVISEMACLAAIG